MTEHNVTEIDVDLGALRELVREANSLSRWVDTIRVKIRTVWIDATLVPVGDITFSHQRDYPNGKTESYLLLGSHAQKIPD